MKSYQFDFKEILIPLSNIENEFEDGYFDGLKFCENKIKVDGRKLTDVICVFYHKISKLYGGLENNKDYLNNYYQNEYFKNIIKMRNTSKKVGSDIIAIRVKRGEIKNDSE